MIASVRGTALHVGLDRVVVEVGGVGMLVHTTPAIAASIRPGAEANLATTLVVREDSLTLYGFNDTGERDLFEQVQTVSGVGPRLALAMLAVHPPQVLRPAIASGDVATLTKVPGIGKKGAERIILELKDKVGALPGEAATTRAPESSPAGVGADKQQVIDALVGLGWSTKQATDAVGSLDDAPVPTMLRDALRSLGR